jgi:hypothetical protein
LRTYLRVRSTFSLVHSSMISSISGNHS